MPGAYRLSRQTDMTEVQFECSMEKHEEKNGGVKCWSEELYKGVLDKAHFISYTELANSQTVFQPYRHSLPQRQ